MLTLAGTSRIVAMAKTAQTCLVCRPAYCFVSCEKMNPVDLLAAAVRFCVSAYGVMLFS